MMRADSVALTMRAGSATAPRLTVEHRNLGELVEHAAVPRQPRPYPDTDERRHQCEDQDPDHMPPERAHSAAPVPSPCKYAISASSSLLPSSISGAASISSSSYGSPRRFRLRIQI